MQIPRCVDTGAEAVAVTVTTTHAGWLRRARGVSRECVRQIDVSSFVKVQKTVKSRGDVMEDGAIVLPEVFTASAAFVSANRFPRQRAQRT
jgi:hypothetical protein